MLFSTIVLIFITAVIVFMSISFYITMFGGGPFVPTPMRAVHKVLKAAKIKPGQKVYDIGAGDGRFVHFAAKDYKANAVGFELDPFVYFLSKIRQKLWGWKGTMKRTNFLHESIKDADVIICYMLPRSLKQYQKKFEKELKKGAKIVSYAFSIGDMKPTKVIPKEKNISKIILYQG